MLIYVQLSLRWSYSLYPSVFRLNLYEWDVEGGSHEYSKINLRAHFEIPNGQNRVVLIFFYSLARFSFTGFSFLSFVAFIEFRVTSWSDEETNESFAVIMTSSIIDQVLWMTGVFQSGEKSDGCHSKEGNGNKFFREKSSCPSVHSLMSDVIS